jgi:predicted DNA-binding protein (MmcQ/YjbR family)
MTLKNPTAPGTRTRATAAEARLRKLALSLPEVREDHPWGHSAFKVAKKAFLFMASENGGLSLSVKLPQSGLLALSLPFAQPTGYGLGKSGWVTASFTRKQSPPIPVLERWVDESYRTIAPKKLLVRLEAPVKTSRPSRGGAR